MPQNGPKHLDLLPLNRKTGKPIEDLRGREFGYLTVVSFSRIDDRRQSRWNAVCKCGRTKADLLGYNLKSKAGAKSCGCRKAEANRDRCELHGHAKRGLVSTEYTAWRAMISRCSGMNSRRNRKYKSLTVCRRWRNSFEFFLQDMGLKPSPKHSLDRIKNSVGYRPGNCRWATIKEQNRNRRNNRLLTFDGKTKCLAAWAEDTGLSRSMISQRLADGWSVRRALTTPSRMARTCKRKNLLVAS